MKGELKGSFENEQEEMKKRFEQYNKSYEHLTEVLSKLKILLREVGEGFSVETEPIRRQWHTVANRYSTKK